MTFYHGSPIADLKELKPILSEHGQAYVYFSTNPLVALLYSVKPVPKPFSWYPYGFDSKGNIIYSEYFENAFEKTYKGKTGYLYECDDISDVEQPTQINCAYTCKNCIKIDRVTKIPDLYQYFKEQEKEGLFKIKPLNAISEKEMNFVLEDLISTIDKFNLTTHPQNPMTVFIKENFTELYNNFF
ncbi:MAG: hypothetical protein K2I73_04550 [Eubacterium sp.]|nr:hypothetical protein [Eubacterium sp.]